MGILQETVSNAVMMIQGATARDPTASKAGGVSISYTKRTVHYSGFGQMRGLNDGRTISDAAFGMFRATVEETESTSLYKVGVGGLKKSVHVEREAVEVEHATWARRAALGGGEQRSQLLRVPPRDGLKFQDL